jgi:hypothetical protein
VVFESTSEGSYRGEETAPEHRHRAGGFLIILFYFILGVLSRAKDERNCEDLRSQITIHRCRKIGN